MRLFFALLPDPSTRERLHRRALLVQRHCGGRVLPPASLHLTLAFLGNVPSEHTGALVGLTRAFTVPPGVLTFAHLGVFSRRRIIWAGPEADDGLDGLLTLQSSLLERLRAPDTLAVAPAAEAFRPHVSLVRNAKSPELAGISLHPVPWSYDSAALMASEPAGGRHRYVELARSPNQHE